MTMKTNVMDADAINKRLLVIAGKHCKLALEALERGVTVQRKTDIMIEIEALRMERTVLVDALKSKELW